MRKLIAFLMLICFAQQVAAQQIGGFNVPTDVQSQPGGGYSPVTPTYSTSDAVSNVSLDAVANPPPQVGLTNIAIPSNTARLFANTVPERSGNGVTCTSFGLDHGAGGDTSCGEAKFRTHADFTLYAPIDPVRNFNQGFASHLHCFFGTGAITPNATYKSLRTHAILSAAAGTDVNGTGYWYPCVIVKNRDGDGKDYVVKLDYAIIYYVHDGDTAAQVAEDMRAAALIPGLRYVFGYNMDTGTIGNSGYGSYMANVVAAANAASAAAGGTPNRYRLNGTGITNFAGNYNCSGATPNQVSYLKTATGGDPFNGTCHGAAVMGYIAGSTLTVTSVITGTVPVANGGVNIVSSGDKCTSSCVTSGTNVIGAQISGTPGGVGTYNVNVSQTAGSAASPIYMDIYQQFWIGISGSECWDRTNLWSDGGYKNVIPTISDQLKGERVCPTNYARVPTLSLELHFTHYDWADYGRWELSSDAPARTKINANLGNGSGTTTNYPDGFSLHADWMHGWDQNVMIRWQKSCLGVLQNLPHQCAVSQIDGTTRLVGGIVDGEAGVIRSPQINTGSDPRGSTTGYGSSGWGLIPPAWNAGMTGMHFCPGNNSHNPSDNSKKC